MTTTEKRPARIRLELLTVPPPCPADWSAMTAVGDGERVRHCRHCDRHVYDLSALPRAAAERLVADQLSADAPLCVRMVRRADGTVTTRRLPRPVAVGGRALGRPLGWAGRRGPVDPAGHARLRRAGPAAGRHHGLPGPRGRQRHGGTAPAGHRAHRPRRPPSRSRSYPPIMGRVGMQHLPKQHG